MWRLKLVRKLVRNQVKNTGKLALDGALEWRCAPWEFVVFMLSIHSHFWQELLVFHGESTASSNSVYVVWVRLTPHPDLGYGG